MKPKKDDARPIEPDGSAVDRSDPEEITETNIELARQAGASETSVETTRLEDVSDGAVREHPDGGADSASADEKAERILRDGLIWL